MSTFDSISALSPQTQAATNTAKSSATDLDIDDFLTLMTAQLKNQDPTEPLDSTAFVAQLAEFGTVSGIQSMEVSLDSLSESLRSSQALQGATLVGRDVVVAADSIVFTSGDTVQGELTIPEGTANVTFTVKDASGQIVRHIDIPAGAGTTGFVWDGLDDSGIAVGSGTYRLEAVANVGGSAEAVEIALTGRVSSVTIDASGGLTLNTATLGSLALADIRRVM